MLLLDTILLRPYVFVFLLIYVIGCSLHFGFKRMLLFGAIGYGIAWLSELSSIHTGFPYGSYYYIEGTRGREIWVLGVPLMDSISYVFLAYASYSLALFAIAPVRRMKWTVYLLETRQIRNSVFAALLGSVLFVYLDIIIDPVALQGDHWFLGLIYGYPDGGTYFGVPLSNFAGWFVTGFLMIFAFQKIDNALHKRKATDYSGGQYPWRHLIGPILYFSVLVFNLGVTFFIGEETMGWVGVFIVLLLSVLVYVIIRIKLSAESSENEIAAHLRDFPEAAIEKPERPVSRRDAKAAQV